MSSLDELGRLRDFVAMVRDGATGKYMVLRTGRGDAHNNYAVQVAWICFTCRNTVSYPEYNASDIRHDRKYICGHAMTAISGEGVDVDGMRRIMDYQPTNILLANDEQA